MIYDNGSKAGVSCFKDGRKNQKPGTAGGFHKLEKKKKKKETNSPLKEQSTIHTLIIIR